MSMRETHGIPDATSDMDAILAAQDHFFEGTLVGALGIRITHAEAGRARAEMPVTGTTKHPGGYVHGGAIAAFGDSCAAWATLPALAPGWNFSTIQFQTNFMRAVTEGMLHAEAREVHRGQRTQVLDVRITDADDRLIATMTITQSLLAPRS